MRRRLVSQRAIRHAGDDRGRKGGIGLANEKELLTKLLEMSHYEVGGQPAGLRDTDVLITSLIDGERAPVAASLMASRIAAEGDRKVLRGVLMGSALRRRRAILMTKANFDAFTITLPAVALSASLSALIFFNTSALGPVSATYIGVLSFVAAAGLLFLRLVWGFRVEQTEADIKTIEAVADLIKL
jgi:hypothetical protein